MKNKTNLSLLLVLTLISVALLGATNFGMAAIVAEDSYEENDTMAEGYVVSEGWLFTLSQRDDDWFNISVDAGMVLTVTLIYEEASNPMNVQLYHSGGYMPMESFQNMGKDYLEYTMPYADVMCVRVYGNDNGEQYNLRLNIQTQDDIWEENDEFTQAASIEGINYLDCVMNDVDYYKFHLDAWSSVYILGTHGLANIMSMEMLDPMENQINGSVYNSQDSVTIGFQAYNASIEIILKVQTTVFEFNYSLDFLYQNYTADDDFEPNNNIAWSRTIQPGYFTDLINNDDDFFMFSAFEDANLTIEVSAMDMGPYILTLYDSAYNPLFTQTENYYVEIEIKTNYTGTYFIGVMGPNTGSLYDIYLNLVHSDDDMYEPNDDLDHSWYSAMYEPFEMDNMKNYNDDWIEVQVESDQTLRIELDSGEASYLWMELYDYSHNQIAWSFNEGYGYSIEYTNQQAYGVTVYLKVSGDNLGRSYDLRFDFWYHHMGDDSYEENEYFNQAWWFNAPAVVQGLVCYDSDWFRFEVQNGDLAEIYINTSYTFYAYFYDSNYTYIGYADTNGMNPLYFWFIANATTDYFIQLSSASYMGESYDLDIKINGVSGVLDDSFEENDYWGASYSLDLYNEGDYYNLIQLDDDFYMIHVDPNDELYINLDIISGDFLTLDDINPNDGTLIRSFTNYAGSSTITMSFAASSMIENYVIAVRGNNAGYQYELHLSYQNMGNVNPSYDWVAFNQSDYFEWNVTIELDNNDQNDGPEETYTGSLGLTVQSLSLNMYSLGSTWSINWMNLPAQYLDGPASQSYTVDIYENGMVNPSFFGFGSPLVGKNFDFNEQYNAPAAAQESTGMDFSFDVRDDGKTIIIDSTTESETWFHFEISYSADGIMQKMLSQMEVFDQYNNPSGKLTTKIDLTSSDIGDNSTDGGDDGSDGSDLPALPFGEIPGFPLEIMGGFMMIAIFAVVIRTKKRS